MKRGTFSVAVWVAISVGFLCSCFSANQANAEQFVLTIPASCTLSSSVVTSHTASIHNFEYVDDIGTTAFTATCNDADGFAVYAIGFTDDTYGKTVLTDSSLGSSYDIVTGTATSGNTSNWAMKLTAVSGSITPIIVGSSADSEKTVSTPDYSDYVAVPSTYAKVAYRNAVTGVGAHGATLNTTYAAYISGSQAAGTYEGQVKYTLVHPSSEVPLQPQVTESGKICYYPNGGNVVGTMGCQTIGTSSGTTSTSATLLASNYSRDGYGFAGWSDTFDYSAGTVFYGSQEDITFTEGQYSGSDGGLSLYAVWVPSEGYLQDSTKVSQLCGAGSGSLTQAPINGAANLDSVSALTDQRDNQTYAIAKLADGKCWMIENLRLESTAAHNSDGTLAQGYGTSSSYGNFSGLADAESSNFNDVTTANSLYYFGTQSGTATIDIGTSNYPGYRMPRYNNLNTRSRATNPTSNIFSDNGVTGGMYSYGNYYTWSAAIADTTYYGTNNTSSNNTSLCPAGWKLPRGGDKTRIGSNDDNDFWNLVVDGLNGGTNPANYSSQTKPYYSGATEYDSIIAKLKKYPNNFLYSGQYGVSSAYDRGHVGSYWSSTTSGEYTSYRLFFKNSDLYPGTDSNFKILAHSIRCTTGI